ncbi:hypothetical protein N865_08685 [Intrasporangium oryzae NRRL B-24470]|uniref:CopC domain-containing protein n=1 Tax=Intrasporangium oryzae NRRL B-24470 TaxID=1386089 RepID=W9G982_9MICO|nr:copper resistance CopC family protein [Intrasporangium oryzae]EWT01393.1 hypothetical protein N865_08685 [Intrasporangium oryzae NRRL B-24470]
MVLGLVVAVAGVVLPAGTSQAHAYLAASSPADGDSVERAPDRLRLDFSEHVQLASTRITLVDQEGHATILGNLELESGTPEPGPDAAPDEAATAGPGAGAEDTESPVSVVAPLPDLRQGAYHVAWETLSSDDLHRTAGVLAFGVGDTVDAVGLSETAPEGTEVLGRWAVLAGLALALGSLVVSTLLLSSVGDERARTRLRRRLTRLRRAGAAGAALAALALLIVELSRSGTEALSTPYAVKWAARTAGLVLLALPGAGPVAADRRPRARGTSSVDTVVLGLGVVLACVGTVLLGHVGARGGPTWYLAATLHLASGAAWAGAVTLLAGTATRRRPLRLGGGDLGSLLRAFRWPAAGLVTVVGVTGVLLASDVVGSVDAALVTVYGRVLLLKSGLVAVALLLALWTTLALRTRPAARSATRIAVEATVAVGVLGLAAALASGQPALQPELVSSGPTASTIVDRHVADLQETLTLRPNRPGASIAFVDVLDTRRPSIGPVLGVTVTVGRGRPVEASRVDGTRWAAPVTLPATGTTPVRVDVRRRGVDPVSADHTWVVGRAGAVRPILVSTAPVAGSLRASGAVLLVLAGLGWWFALQRRRARSSAEPLLVVESVREEGVQA